MRLRRRCWMSFAAMIAASAATTHCKRSKSDSATSPSAGQGGDGGVAPLSVSLRPESREGTTIDLLPAFREGAIDVDGPVVDLGELQARAFLQDPLPLSNESLNGDSWSTVGPSFRVRVPVNTERPPTLFRMRVRHIGARNAIVLVDGLHARQFSFPQNVQTHEIRVPIAPDAFRRSVVDVQVRFFGFTRTMSSLTQATGPTPAGPAALASRPVMDVDWVHLLHVPSLMPAPTPTPTTPVVRSRTRPRLNATQAPPRPAPLTPPIVMRVADMVNDVRADGTPRRSLTLYPPTTLSIVRVVPPHATLRAAFSAEGIRGRALEKVTGTLRVEADGESPREQSFETHAGEPWHEVSLDLSALVGRAVRISVHAEGSERTRLAVADPRLETQPELQPPPGGGVRHVLMVVLRGLRTDRFLPTLSPRLNAGGFSRLVESGIVARAMVAAPRALPSLVSVVTGQPWWAHGLNEYTDVLEEQVPTMASALHAAGVATASFSDDRWFEGSGLDRGMNEHHGCRHPDVQCDGAETVRDATEWLIQQQERRAFALAVVGSTYTARLRTKKETLATLDPTPAESARVDDLAALAARSRQTPANPIVRLVESEPLRNRVGVLYDAALIEMDRALNVTIDRLRDTGLLADTMIVVVGDMGSALGEAGLVGDATVSLQTVSHTPLLVVAPGVAPNKPNEVFSVLDVAETVRERMGVGAAQSTSETEAPFVPRSVFSQREDGLVHPRGVVVPLGGRGDLGLRFGDLFATSKVTGVTRFALILPDKDPLGQTDLAMQRTNAAAYAQLILANERAWLRDRVTALGWPIVAPTRALPDPVAAALRESFLLRR